MWALGILAEHPGIGVNDLAQAMDVHQSTASNLLRRLVADKLVTTRRDETDKRAVHLFVTEAGERMLAKAPVPYSGVLPDALLELDRKTLARLQADLAELIEVLSPKKDGAHIPLGQSQL